MNLFSSLSLRVVTHVQLMFRTLAVMFSARGRQLATARGATLFEYAIILGIVVFIAGAVYIVFSNVIQDQANSGTTFTPKK